MLTWISAVMAAFRADSSPPSAIRLLTRRSIMKRRPGLTLISLADAGKHRNAFDHQPPHGPFNAKREFLALLHISTGSMVPKNCWKRCCFINQPNGIYRSNVYVLYSNALGTKGCALVKVMKQNTNTPLKTFSLL